MAYFAIQYVMQRQTIVRECMHHSTTDFFIIIIINSGLSCMLQSRGGFHPDLDTTARSRADAEQPFSSRKYLYCVCAYTVHPQCGIHASDRASVSSCSPVRLSR